MKIGRLKELIKDVPDDYILQVEINVHFDDIYDVLEQRLVTKFSEVDNKNKCFRIESALWSASHSSTEVNNS